jgi:fucose 4-O-acetylase-like acetyltransferase
MWYLYALIVWELIILLIPENLRNNINPIFIIVLSFVLSLASGFFEQIGYDYSISRIITFFPFFLFGFFEKNRNINIIKYDKENKYKTTFYVAILIIASIYFIFNIKYKNERCLYGTFSYINMNYSVIYKLMWILFSLGVSFILLSFMSNKKIMIISKIGSNTLSIYLVHGIIVKLLSKYKSCFFVDSYILNILIITLITLLILTAFGNDFIKEIINIDIIKRKSE